jgi:hypothetical protein
MATLTVDIPCAFKPLEQPSRQRVSRLEITMLLSAISCSTICLFSSSIPNQD